MKIQGLLDAVVDPEAARVRPAPPVPEAKPKERNEPAPPATHSAPSSTDYSKELEKIAEAVRKYLQYHRTSVDISFDEDLRQIVTKILDEDSGKVVRQYPADAALAVMRHLKELRGLLLHKKG
ncbi:MAG: hypothetical protein OHK0028_24680 [Deltaproteobacteria bacterium]